MLALDLSGPGRLRLDTTVSQVSEPAPDNMVSVTADLTRVTSYESAAAASRFVSSRLSLSAAQYPAKQAGATWWVALTEEAQTPQARPFKGPAPRVAGQQALEAPAPPLDTGRPVTTVPLLREFFASIPQIAVYLNIPCAYTVAGAMYWGRALRLNDRFIQVNTAQVLPGLGVRLRCDLTVELDGHKRPVSLFGILSQKKDPPGGSTYKATLSVRIQRIDEGDSPGLLIEYLTRHQTDDEAEET